MNWSLLFSFFPSLTLHHLEKSIFSLSRQTAQPSEWIFYDNNSPYSEDEIKAVVVQHFPLEVWRFVFDKHGDRTKTASYAHNKLIPLAANDAFILTRADLIFDFDFCRKVIEAYGNDPMNYAASWMLQMGYLSQASHETVDHASELESLNWREDPQRLLQNTVGSQEHKLPELDSAAFCTSKTAFHLAGGYDEHLNTWGLWQMSFQTELRSRGVHFKVVPEFLTFHMLHELAPGEGERDQSKAYQQFLNSPRRGMKGFQP